VVLLEVFYGKMNLVTSVQQCIREGTINQIIDPYLMGKIAPECFKIYMDIATSCVRTQGTQRPTIGEVEVALEHALELQESKDMDPGIGGADQYMYPILEYTPDSPLFGIFCLRSSLKMNLIRIQIASHLPDWASCPCTPPNGR
jgi:hypothetical protein